MSGRQENKGAMPCPIHWRALRAFFARVLVDKWAAFAKKRPGLLIDGNNLKREYFSVKVYVEEEDEEGGADAHDEVNRGSAKGVLQRDGTVPRTVQREVNRGSAKGGLQRDGDRAPDRATGSESW